MEIAQVISNKLRRDAYSHILPLLRSKGRSAEAALVQSTLTTIPSRYSEPASPSLESSASRSARIVAITDVLAAIFGIATALWLICIVALRWKADMGVSQLLNRIASCLCFAPASLLLASVALYLGYYPYVRSLGEIHSYKDLEYAYFRIQVAFYHATHFHSSSANVWLARMFWPTVWCAVVALLGAGLLWWVRHRPRPDRPDAA